MSDTRKYKKDYRKWCLEKKYLNENAKHKRAKPGQVWWSKLGTNIGREQDGGKTFERPVVILHRINYFLTLVAPLTSSEVENLNPSSYIVLKEAKINSIVLLLQIRVISTKRLTRFIEQLTTSDYTIIIKKLSNFYKIHP